ncbi:MAG: hypothetical protein AB1Z23_11265 [Eubacteriales bacterium]
MQRVTGSSAALYLMETAKGSKRGSADADIDDRDEEELIIWSLHSLNYPFN